MAYGELKVDSITFTDGGTDTTVSVSGLVQNPTFSGDITVTGTISGDVILGGTTVSGATVTGTAGEFGTVTGNTAGFTTVTGTTVTGSTANFVSGTFTTQVSGTTVTGNLAQFTTLTGGTAGFTTVTGTTVTGSAGQFVTVTGNTAGFTTVTGTTVTGTTANFVTVSGTTVTGNAGNFTTATVTSGVFASGTAAAPSVSVGTTDNGLYSPGTDQVAISTNGTGRLFVDASGNVGIGTASPSSELEISSATTPTLTLVDTTNTCTSIFEAGNTEGRVGTSSAHDFTVRTNNQERLRIDSSGRLGLGTSSPENTLNVVGASATTNTGATILVDDSASLAADIGGSIAFRGTDGSTSRTYGLIRGGKSNAGAGGFDGYLAFETRTNGEANTRERLRITNTGNVGIGTTNPTALFHIQKDTGAQINLGTGTSSANSVQGLNFYGRFISGTTPALPGQLTSYIREERQGPSAVFDLTFGTATTGDATERARITSNGKLGLGTSTPPALFSAHSADTSADFFIGEFQSAANLTGLSNTYVKFEKGDGFGGAVGGFIEQNVGAGLKLATLNGGTLTDVVTIRNTGNVGIGTTSPGVALHVDGDIRCDGVYGETDTDTSIQFPGSNVITFNEGGSEVARINNSGKLAVGTTITRGVITSQASAGVTVTYNDNDGDAFFISNENISAGSGNFGAGITWGRPEVSGTQRVASIASVQTASDNDQCGLVFFTKANAGNTVDLQESLRITHNGKVGIGTTDPSYELQVSSGAGTTISIEATNDNTSAIAGRLVYSFDDGDGAAINATRATGQTAADVDLSFRTGGITNSEEKMRILANGNVGIGTTSPSSLLHLADAGDITVGTTTGTKIGTATSQKIGFYNATPVVQPTAVADITTTATSGSLPTPDGSVTIADAATPTVTELLKYCVELEAKLEAALGHLRTLGLIAT